MNLSLNKTYKNEQSDEKRHLLDVRGSTKNPFALLANSSPSNPRTKKIMIIGGLIMPWGIDLDQKPISFN